MADSRTVAHSPDVQEESILAWAKASCREVVIQPHELNVSGGTMDRPVFNRLMRLSTPEGSGREAPLTAGREALNRR